MRTEIWKVKTDSESSFIYAREAMRSETPEVEIEVLNGADILEIVRGAASQANRAEYAGIIDVRLRVPPNQRIYSYGVESADIDRYLAEGK